MLKKFGNKVSIGLLCSSLLIFTSAPVFASTNVSVNGKTTYTPASTSIAKASKRTLSDIELTTLTNVDGKTLTAGDTTDVFYVGYIATDSKGKPTTSYRLLEKGLVLTGDHMLTTSTPYVLAQLVKDPTDSKKGLIKVTATSDPITVSMPITIVAMTLSGKTSQIGTMLLKQLEVDTFTLQAPSESIASGESKVIPFVAYDQNGNVMTKYSDLYGYITLYNAHFVKNPDGTASVENDIVYNTGTTPVPIVISASTRTGNYSDITINIQPIITQEKIAKINITSTKLEVVNSTANGITTQTGYATYQVLDQFGNDITTSALANGIRFQSGVGAVEGKNGLLTLTPTMDLMTFTSGVVITGYDPVNGVATSETLFVNAAK